MLVRALAFTSAEELRLAWECVFEYAVIKEVLVKANDQLETWTCAELCTPESRTRPLPHFTVLGKA